MTGNSGVLDTRRSTSRGGKQRRLYSLVEVAQETGIPMPILLRYKREHPDRVPSEGSGSQQRFPEEAFDVLQRIHKEEAEGRELPRRGGFGLLSLPRLRKQVRPPDDEGERAAEEAAAGAETAAAAQSAPEAPKVPRRTTSRQDRTGAGSASGVEERGELLSLVDISKRVDIPYPTLARYASQYSDRIPHQGKGRARRFPPEAIEVFQQIRRESKPGRPPKAKKQRAAATAAPAKAVRAPRTAEPPSPRGPEAGAEGQLAGRIASLEESQRLLETQISELISALSKPATVTVHDA